MGTQAFMNIEGKQTASASDTSSGTATYPNAGEVSIIFMATPLNEQHRELEMYNGIVHCLNYLRDTNKFTGIGANITAMIPIGGAQSQVVQTAISGVVNGNVAVALNGTVRGSGNLLSIDEAHKQLLDWVRENKRFVT